MAKEHFRKGECQDLSGQRFGKLVADTRSNSQGRVRWHCHCDCGNTIDVQAIHLKRGAIRSCKCLLKLRKYLEQGMAAKKSLYSVYQSRSKKYGREFSLSFEYFIELTSKNCTYCEKPPLQVHGSKMKHGSYIYNGIDRLDNEVGYDLENCVSCCRICNHMKRDMGQTEFLKHIQTISENFQRYQLKESSMTIDKISMTKQIAAAVLSQDQLVFKYLRDTGDVVVRYATPIELKDDTVLCAQHLPKEGFRKFKLDKIIDFHRVISRDSFASILSKKDTSPVDPAGSQAVVVP